MLIKILEKYEFIIEKKQITNIWYNYKYFGVKIEYDNKIIKFYNKKFNINDFERVIIIYKTMLDFIIHINNSINNTFRHKCLGEDLDNDQWYYHNYKYAIDYDINGINIYKRLSKNKYELFENINYELINNKLINNENINFDRIKLN